MFCTRLLAVLCISLAAGNAFGGFDFQIQTLKGAIPTTTFMLGDTVTVRVNLVDDGTPPPNFATDTLQAFTATVTASNTQPNSGLPATYNPVFNASTTTVGSNFTAVGGVSFSGQASGVGSLVSSPVNLVEFSYTPTVAGGTTFGFTNPALNSASFVTPGSFPAEYQAGGLLASTTISVVPEPTACGVLALVGLGLGFRRRRSLV